MPGSRSGRFHRSVVVAVVAVLVMQMALHQIVNMVAMGHCLMPAVWAVTVALVMALAGVARGAVGRILGAYFNHVLLNSRRSLMVQMPIVQIIDMITMLHRGVSARFAVLVIVVFACHDELFLSLDGFLKQSSVQRPGAFVVVNRSNRPVCQFGCMINRIA